MTYGALNQEIVGSHTEQEWADTVAAYAWRCFYCARPTCKDSENPERELTKDHLQPIARGGVDFIWNIVPACFACNRLKGIMTAEEFRAQRLALSTIVEKNPPQSTGTALSKNTLANFPQQAVDYLADKMRMEPARSDTYYKSRRETLRHQASVMAHRRLETYGQLTLPIFGDGTPRKLMETEPQTLAFKGLDLEEEQA